MVLAIIGGYALIVLIAARFAYRPVREDFGSDDATDRFMGAVVALIAGLFWPLALPVAIIMWHPKPTAAETEAALYEREMENRQLQRRIAELERELKIGGTS